MLLAKCDCVDIHMLAEQIGSRFLNCGRVLFLDLVNACPTSNTCGQALRRQMVMHALCGSAKLCSDDKLLQVVSNLKQECIDSIHTLNTTLWLLNEVLHHESADYNSSRDAFKKQLVALRQLPRLRATADQNVCDIRESLDFFIRTHKPEAAEHRVGAAISGFDL